MRYLTGSSELDLKYGSTQIKEVEKVKEAVDEGLSDYTDAAYADCLDTRSFTSGYIYFLWNGSISWSFKRQTCVNTFIAEAEYVDECNASKEVVFLVQALKKMSYEGKNTRFTTIMIDNQTVIKMISNFINYSRVKHINVAYHYVRDKVKEEAVKLNYIFIN